MEIPESLLTGLLLSKGSSRGASELIGFFLSDMHTRQDFMTSFITRVLTQKIRTFFFFFAVNFAEIYACRITGDFPN